MFSQRNLNGSKQYIKMMFDDDVHPILIALGAFVGMFSTSFSVENQTLQVCRVLHNWMLNFLLRFKVEYQLLSWVDVNG